MKGIPLSLDSNVSTSHKVDNIRGESLYHSSPFMGFKDIRCLLKISLLMISKNWIRLCIQKKTKRMFHVCLLSRLMAANMYFSKIEDLMFEILEIAQLQDVILSFGSYLCITIVSHGNTNVCI
ncbi:uncharacterized protein [Rutidosis leptorrhynchoides]|uniref:uncharacterized protein n=1 Tax=Rutidosis leptorrhynchoides TaxID=125765 RepID=UPI003A9939E6